MFSTYPLLQWRPTWAEVAVLATKTSVPPRDNILLICCIRSIAINDVGFVKQYDNINNYVSCDGLRAWHEPYKWAKKFH